MLAAPQAAPKSSQLPRRWRNRSRSFFAETVRAAAQAVADLRRAQPAKYPATPHTWYALKGQTEGEELMAPVLCASCFTRADPDGEVRLLWQMSGPGFLPV